MDLTDFFTEHPKAAIAFSGGTDSAYLLYEALRCGADVRPYYVHTVFQPRFEFEDAKRIAGLLSAPLTVLELDILQNECIVANPPDRCYHCKMAMMSAILQAAQKDGYAVLLDGTNASDSEEDRPGMRALVELQILSPLRLCGLTKDQIRALSKEAGLFTWDKPAYACLATRAAPGRMFTKEALARTEDAEDYLYDLGFRNFRVRDYADGALIQVSAEQLQMVLDRRKDILESLKPAYDRVWLDLDTR